MFNQLRPENKLSSKLFRGLLLAALFLLLTGLAMYLWNSVLTLVTHITTINYWQALGLMILCRILFGGVPGGWGWGDGRGGLKDKLINMSDDDRAAFKEEWRKRCERKKEQ
jgi:hypothetical protein